MKAPAAGRPRPSDTSCLSVCCRRWIQNPTARCPRQPGHPRSQTRKRPTWIRKYVRLLAGADDWYYWRLQSRSLVGNCQLSALGFA